MTQKFKYTFLAALSWAIAIIIARFIYIRWKRLQRRFLDYYFLGSIWGIVFLKQKERLKNYPI